MAIETRGFRLSRFPGVNVDMRVQGNTLSGLGRGIGQGLQALGQQRREGQQKAELEAFNDQIASKTLENLGVQPEEGVSPTVQLQGLMQASKLTPEPKKVDLAKQIADAAEIYAPMVNFQEGSTDIASLPTEFQGLDDVTQAAILDEAKSRRVKFLKDMADLEGDVPQDEASFIELKDEKGKPTGKFFTPRAPGLYEKTETGEFRQEDKVGDRPTVRVVEEKDRLGRPTGNVFAHVITTTPEGVQIRRQKIEGDEVTIPLTGPESVIPSVVVPPGTDLDVPTVTAAEAEDLLNSGQIREGDVINLIDEDGNFIGRQRIEVEE